MKELMKAPKLQTAIEDKSSQAVSMTMISQNTTLGLESAAPAPAAATPTNALVIQKEEGLTEAQAIAKAALSPIYTGSVTARKFSNSISDEIGVNEGLEVLLKMVNRVNAGDMSDVESMLVAQSMALNCIFTDMAGRAAHSMGKNIVLTETYMRMALKAQTQCRSTIETLAEIKSPRQATFVRQQNIANQQQVNNGTGQPAQHTRTHGGENPNRSNELLEAHHGERLDSRTARATSGANPHMEAVGQVNRAKDRRG